MISAFLLLGQLQPSLAQSIDNIATEQLNMNCKGLAVAVLKDGKQLYAKGFGGDGKIKAGSKFRIGSVTKQFTSGLIVILVREGKLSYSDNLGKLIPETPREWHAVTIHQLLNHTNGIPSYTENPKFFEIMNQPVSPDGIWKFVQNDKMNFKPSQGWRYNNTGYAILGSIAERATKKRYFQLLDQYIFKPLRMSNTGEENRHKPIPSFGDGNEPSPPINMDWPYAAGAIVSTVVDLGKWDTALHGNKLFSDAEKQLMFSADPVTTKFGKSYGYGWVPRVVNGEVVEVQHGGGINGFSSMISRNLKSGYSIIVLNNNMSGAASNVTKRVSKLLDPGNGADVVKTPDANPTITARHEALFKSFLNGTIKESAFSEGFLKMVPFSAIQETRAQYERMGTLAEFRFSSVVKGGRSYAVRIGSSEMKFWISEGPDGKIVGMMIGE
jgi:D-alanyl-D-alanine carboxypeptidase